MTNLEPVTRVEHYLAKIAGQDVDELEPVTRIEHYLAKIAGQDVEVPEPFTRIEKFLYSLITETPSGLTPVTRQEHFISGNDAELEAISREEIFWEDANEQLAYHTITGAIVSFFAKKSKPVKELIAAINPVQDLHGYDNPWPAGGGKNLLKPTLTTTTEGNVTFTVDQQGIVTANSSGAASSTVAIVYGEISVTNGTAYTINGLQSNGSNTTFSMQLMRAGLVIGTIEGAYLPYTATADETLYLRLVVRSGYTASNLVFKPMIRLSSITDTNFAPYSNLCPISGWSGANVMETGTNIFPPTQMMTNAYIQTNGEIVGQIQYNVYYCAVKKGLTYTYVMDTGTPIYAFYASEPTIGSVSYNGSRSTGTSGQVNVTVTAPIDGYLAFRIASTFTTPMVIVGTTVPDSYEPYTGTTYPITFPDSAGTVYGGTLTVNEDGTGKLRVTHKGVNMGNLSWNYRSNSGSEAFYASLDGCDFGEANTSICSAYSFQKYITGLSQLVGVENGKYAMFKNGAVVYVRDKNYTTKEAFTTAVMGQTFVYPLATPIEHSLTATQMQTLLGTNNWWVDTGNLTMTVYGKEIVEPDVEPLQALNLLLGNAYVNNHTAEDVPDAEALDILMGGTR